MPKSLIARLVMISCSKPKFHRTNTGTGVETLISIHHWWRIMTRRLDKCWSEATGCSITLTLFYITYSIFEVPSNYCLKRFGPSVRTVYLLAYSRIVFHDNRKHANTLLCRNGLHSSCSVGVWLQSVPAASPTSLHWQPHASCLGSLRLVSCKSVPTSERNPCQLHSVGAKP